MNDQLRVVEDILERTTTASELYDELQPQIGDAWERSKRLAALAWQLEERREYRMAAVAYAWAARQKRLAEGLESLRDWIVDVCREEAARAS